jgi:phosphoglycolate phosphatase
MKTALNGVTLAFDLDGTLVDTAPDIIGALNQILIEDAITPFALEQARPLIGRGAMALLRRAFDLAGHALDDEQTARMLKRFLDVYAARIDDLSRPYEGLDAALDALQGYGARFCVCTNKPHYLSVALLDRLGLSPRFGAVFGADAVNNKKPDAGHLWACVDAMQADRTKTVMIGDSETDFMTGRNAGVPVILFTHGYSDASLAPLRPEALLDHYDQLVAAVLELNL